MTEYLSVEQVLELHRDLVREFGGSSSLRDRGSLEAAVARPAATFAGEDLYADIPHKAAALMHSLALNHPFVDGNKRIAIHVAELFALANNYLPTADDEELERITLRAADGQVSVETLTIWFRQRLRPID